MMLLSGVVCSWRLTRFTTIFLKALQEVLLRARILFPSSAALSRTFGGALASWMSVLMQTLNRFRGCPYCLKSLAFRQLTIEKLSRDSGFIYLDDLPVHWSWAFIIITSVLVV